MKLKATIKYNLHEMVFSILIFYLVIYAILIMSNIAYIASNDNFNSSGLESASVIMLFVVGLNMFKTQFKFLLQNGISRKTKFLGFTISMLIIVILMSVVDTLTSVIANSMMEYTPLFEMISGIDIAGFDVGYIFKSIIFLSSFYAFSMMLGYFITSLYYRMNKTVKIAVSVAVPAFFMFIIPLIDYYTGNVISMSIFKIISFFLDINNGTVNIFYTAAFSTLGFTVLSFLSYITTRKSPVKE